MLAFLRFLPQDRYFYRILLTSLLPLILIYSHTARVGLRSWFYSMATSGIFSVRGTVFQFHVTGRLDSDHECGTLLIRQEDGSFVEIPDIAVSDRNKDVMRLGQKATFHFRKYAPADIHFLLAAECERGVNIFRPISAFYILSLVAALIAVNIITVPVSVLLLDSFFTSTLSRLVFSCVYVGLLGYAVYVIVQIGLLYILPARLGKHFNVQHAS